MKSPEVYACVREELAPVLKALGFKREKALLSWAREHDGQHTVLWCQVSQDGWDPYVGSKFVVEFQRSTSSTVGAPASKRARINKLLTDEQRAEVWSLQNRVIGGLTTAPRTHPTLHVSPDVTKWYLAKFERVAAPYRVTDDVWFRYAELGHVKSWAKFVCRVLPSCLEAVEAHSPE